MSNLQNRQKFTQKRLYPQDLETPVLSSRKLRHGKRKMPITTLISTGLVIFGTLFIGLFVIELYQAKNSAMEKVKVSIADVSNGTESTLPKTVPNNLAVSSLNQEQAIDPNANSTTPATSSAESVKPESSAQKPTKPIGVTKNGGTQTGGSPQSKSTDQGQTVSPPPKSSSGGTGASTQEAAAVKPKLERYVVQKGDTLFSISRKYYGNHSGVDRIIRYNGIDPNAQLLEGKEITIPLPKQ